MWGWQLVRTYASCHEPSPAIFLATQPWICAVLAHRWVEVKAQEIFTVDSEHWTGGPSSKVGK